MAFSFLSPIILILLLFAAVGVTSSIVSKRNEGGVAGFFSLATIVEKLRLLVVRFPLSILLVVAFATLCFLEVNGLNFIDDIPLQLWFFIAVGIPVSIVATLFAEDRFNNWITYGITLFALLLWGVYCYFLPTKFSDFQLAKTIEVFVIIGTITFSILFISYLKRRSDRAFWNFSTQTILRKVISQIFAGIIFGGLALALVAITMLFGVNFELDVYGNLAVVCFALFAPLYFLANIPDKAEKRNEELAYNKIQKVLTLYILTPILAIYAVILYVYLFQIIIAWQLPIGWVSWLVSTLALGGLLVITCLYPIREIEKNKIVNFISRWFGVIILPLLVLMTIGIFRRIGDHGITINRVYILLINLWFYGIYIYLFLSKSRHIKWILISFVALAFVSSVGFLSAANITKNSLTREISAVLTQPMTVAEAKEIFSKMTQEERQRMESTFQYLQEHFGDESVQPFFSDMITHWNHRTLSQNLGLRESRKRDWEWVRIETATPHQTFDIEGFNTFSQISFWEWNRSRSKINSGQIRHEIIQGEAVLEIEMENLNRSFRIPLKELVLNFEATGERIIRGQDYMLIVEELAGEFYSAQDSIFVNRFYGYWFFRK